MAPHKCYPIPFHRGHRVVIPGSFFRPVDDENPGIVVGRGWGLNEIDARSKVRRYRIAPA